MRRGSGPNDITPIAWKKPSFIMRRELSNVPLDSAGTRKPWVMTVKRIIIILIRAKVEAFANYHIIVSIPFLRIQVEKYGEKEMNSLPLQYLYTNSTDN